MKFLRIQRFFILMICVAPTVFFSNSALTELQTSLTPPDAAEGKAELTTNESDDDRLRGEQSNPPTKSESGDEEDDCE